MLHLRSFRGCGVKLQSAPPPKFQLKQFSHQHTTFKKTPSLSQTKPIWSSQLLVSSRLNTLNTINAFRNQTVVSKLNFIKPNVWQSRNFFNFWSRDQSPEGVATARIRKALTRRSTDSDYEHSYYDYTNRRWVKVGDFDYKPWLKYGPKKLLLYLLLILFGVSAIVEMDLFNKNKDMDYYWRVFTAVFREPMEVAEHMWFSFLNTVLRTVMWLAPFKHGYFASTWRNLVVGEEDWVPYDVFLEPYLPMPYGKEFFLVLDPLLFVSVKFHPIQGWTVMKRPGTDFFFQHVSRQWEITMYTDDFSVIQDSITNRIDPEWDYVSNALYIDTCVRRQGEYYKDVTLLKRPLDRLLLLDGKRRTCDFERNSENCIHIPYWDGDPNDTVLLDLLPFLMDISDEAPDEDVDIRNIVEAVKGVDLANYYKPLRLLAKEATDEQVARKRQEDAAVDNILKQFILDFMETRKEDAAMDPFMYVEDQDPADIVKEVLPHLTPEFKKTHPAPVFQSLTKNWPYHDKSSYRLPYDPLGDSLPGKSVERRLKHLDMLTGKSEDDHLSPDPLTEQQIDEEKMRTEYFRSRYNSLRQKYTPGSAPSPYGDFILDEDDPIEPMGEIGWPEDASEQIQADLLKQQQLMEKQQAMEEEQEFSPVPRRGKKVAPRDPKAVTQERTRRLARRKQSNDEDEISE